MVKLHSFQLRKLFYQRLVNHQLLITVPSRCLVFMFADALLQKLRHHEIRIAQKGRNAHHGATWARKEPQLFPEASRAAPGR